MSAALRDQVFKVLWTMLSAALGALVTYIADLDYGWVVPATAIINWVSVLVRQRVNSDVPPPAEARPSAA